MDYVRPQFDIPVVNASAKILLISPPLRISSAEEKDRVFEAIDVVENWRAAHHYPMNSIYMTLSNRAKRVSSSANTVQRIKRFASILKKLSVPKDKKEKMKLSQMQDVAGCRAVMPNIEAVSSLVRIYKTKPIAHEFLGEKDYIKQPKTTGYRGVHIKYRFRGLGNSMPWDGLKIEIQIRTLLQHKWATAVEAAEIFTRSALKANKGKIGWQRFFSLMSSVFAIKEGCPSIPNTPGSLVELHQEIRDLDAELHISKTFSQYHKLIPRIERKAEAYYYLITLDPIKNEVSIVGFRREHSREANKARFEIEKDLDAESPIQVVLVSAESVSKLKRAYPNYFLDTADFLREVFLIVGSTRSGNSEVS